MAPQHLMGIVRPNRFHTLIYDHQVVAPTSLRLRLRLGHYRFHPGTILPGVRFADEENLPSPFLNRVDKAAAVAAALSSTLNPLNVFSTSVGPPNANGIGMESEGEMMSSSASTGEVGSVDAFVGDCAQGE
jgi:hypothetical protein